ncbi:MAG TPA: TonB-dependent receptor [Thermoanaerobaculia bacterium]|nr:TonB-dependent receptor [Thermoanaerobaculia bacterium]
MKRCPPHWYRAAWAALLVTLMAFSVSAQVQYGSLVGQVVGNDGAALPGVTVTLTGVGAPQATVTDGQGRFRFPNLSPGTYTVKADLAGYGTATRAGIGVRLGASPDITMTLNPSVSQTITVTAEAPLLDTRKSGTGTTVSKVELETVPTGRDPWVILQQTPGVLLDRINVGGNESGQQSTYIGKGSAGDQSTWNVDGVNITDVGSLGSSPAYYDFDSFEEMQITTGGSDPRIQTAGVQLNMVTKRGTNDVTGSARFFNTRNAWQAEPEIPEEAIIVRDSTGKVISGYLENVNEIDNIDDYGVEAGGPIIRDRLWLWAAYSNQQIDLLQASSGVHLNDQTQLENYNGKLNAQILSNNSFSFAGMFGAKVKFGRNVGPGRPQETGWNQDNNYTGPSMWKVEDTHIFSPNFYLTGLFSKVEGGFQLISDNGERCVSIECGLSGSPATWFYTPDPNKEPDLWQYEPHFSYYNYFTERPQTQYRGDASAFLTTGSLNHELRFGLGYRDSEVRSLSAWPGDQLVFLVDEPNGQPAFGQGVQLNRFSDFTYNVGSTDFYIGDTMMLGNLTIQAGLRYDQQVANIQAGVTPANVVSGGSIPQISYPASDDLEWTNISPRLGLTYALGADRKTLLRASLNRYTDQMGGFTVYATSPAAYSYLYYFFDDLNGNGRAEGNEIIREDGPFGNGIQGWYNVDPLNPTVPVRRWDNDLKAPTTDELILGFERQILADFSVGVNGTYRRFNDQIGLWPEKTRGAGDWYTSADYAQVICNPDDWDPEEDAISCSGTNFAFQVPNGGPSFTNIPIYDLDGVDAPVYFAFRNLPDYSQTYTGLELNATKRMSNRWMMRANFTWQDWKQDIGDEGILDPTHLRTATGCSSCDGDIVVQGAGEGSGAKGGIYINSRWAYNLTGAYQIPFIDTSLGFNLTGREGYPIPYILRYSSNEGGKNVLVGDIDEYRLPNVHSLDLRLAKDFRFGPAGLTVSADMFNVLNSNTVLQRQMDYRRTENSQHQITEVLSPRVFRLGARLTF